MTLASLFPARSLNLPPLLRTCHGWIGVDLGSAATKLVQLEQVGDELRLVAHWLIDEYPDELLTRESLARANGLPFQNQLNHARSSFRSRRAAATLPLALTELRSLEFPSSTDDELRSMVQEELYTDAAGETELCFDYLKTPTADHVEGEITALSVFAVSKEIALSMAKSLRTAGLDCEILDGLPCAIARATQLCETEASPAPVAALDFGYSSACFVLARDGRPLFTRTLRGWGLQSLLKPLQDGLRLSPQEAKHLLTQNSQYDESPSLASLAMTAQTMIVEPLSHFTAEVQRTLDFIELRFRSLLPKQLILLGCRALVPQLQEALAAETGLPVRRWSMPATSGQPSRPDEALFGVAAALSALAWEEPSCT